MIRTASLFHPQILFSLRSTKRNLNKEPKSKSRIVTFRAIPIPRSTRNCAIRSAWKSASFQQDMSHYCPRHGISIQTRCQQEKIHIWFIHSQYKAEDGRLADVNLSKKRQWHHFYTLKKLRSAVLKDSWNGLLQQTERFYSFSLTCSAFCITRKGPGALVCAPSSILSGLLARAPVRPHKSNSPKPTARSRKQAQNVFFFY